MGRQKRKQEEKKEGKDSDASAGKPEETMSLKELEQSTIRELSELYCEVRRKGYEPEALVKYVAVVKYYKERGYRMLEFDEDIPKLIKRQRDIYYRGRGSEHPGS